MFETDRKARNEKTARGAKFWIVRAAWILVLGAILFAIVRAFHEDAVLVDVATIRVDTILETVADDGHTRVRERYTVHAPLGGSLTRTALVAGDHVEAGVTTIAQFVPTPPSILDARSREQARATLERASAALDAARARHRQSEADKSLADKELARVRGSFEAGLASERERDAAENAAQRAREGLLADEFAEQVAAHELEVARAMLREPRASDFGQDTGARDHQDEGGGDVRIALTSPIDGSVLRVFEESARAVPAGTPIVEVGNTQRLEIVAEFLSQDAVRVEPGMDARIVGWGSDAQRPLAARVRVVEPGGYTKVSALGVEEQRVRIILDPQGADPEWSRFGDGYHVEVEILLSEAKGVAVVPSGALFQQGESWHVFVVDGDVARDRVLRIGRRSGLRAEVLDGLRVGEQVVLYPDALVSDGSRIAAQRSDA
ncbi:MAG: HlyD family efflux transporter periplasmic adaptor subunit [Planctomycetes bacterium]|nr:HlyD family efflux transporter periplasmic adaptor subunit [Planctomycetota bacterium]